MITSNVHMWPTLYQYTAAHACPSCKAQPGEDCHAPRKQASRQRVNRIIEQVGGEPFLSKLTLQHAERVHAGMRHYDRDIGKAPWTEDRKPGRCYCTLDPCPLAATS
jgi:hypothetical protein